MTSEKEELDVKKLVELKEWIDKRVGELKGEIEILSALSSMLSMVIAEKSFQPASTLAREQATPEQPKPKPVQVEQARGIPIRSSDGTLLAMIYREDTRMRIVFSRELALREDIQPFRAFLIRKVLEPITSQDLEAVSRGRIPPDRAFNYELKVEEGVLRELILNNLYDTARIRDIQSAVRWTLERMYERAKKAG
ncbi:MAG: hypothetical protein QW374_02340 [Candidatus Bathyarchaeia archaeon]|nr:hypothetical protein [Candidatus Bathyarchaeota archaeon]